MIRGIKKGVISVLVIAAAVFMVSGCARKIEPVTQSGFMLNTFVTVTLYDSDDTKILQGAMDLCRSYEAVFSRTMESSELYQMNHRKENQQELAVSDSMSELLERGIYYSRLSEDAFDITIEPLSSLWDFTAENPVIPSTDEIAAAKLKVDYNNLVLNGSNLKFLSPDTTIDLGAIAKGYIADRMKEYLKEQGVNSAVINLGGNVLCVGRKPDGSSFKVGLQKPYADRNETVATLDIDDMSVVASGVYERHFVKDGVNYHHILNPRDGYPYENGLISVTILSKESVDGDGLSTTCFSMGLEKGKALLESMEGVWGIFITEDYQIHYTDGAQQFLSKE